MGRTHTIKETIEMRFSDLSKAQQKVANFVLNNPTFISVHAAAEVGEMAGTSETKVMQYFTSFGIWGTVGGIIATILFTFGASLAGFTTLVGKVYSTMGYLGFALIIAIIVAWARKGKREDSIAA